ncbi:MAG TPA: AraC family transcriptional regulator [Bacteroidota bacterium]|nr:AraC family transcriptional regulator [Bacteroidota bacterium]
MNTKDVDSKNDLLALARRYCREEGIFSTPLPGFKVVRRDATSEAIVGRYASLVCLVLQGEKRVWSGKRVFRYNPENYLVSCVDVPATFQVSKASPQEPYIGLTLELQPSLIYQILHESTVSPVREKDFAGGFYVEKVTADLADAFARLLRSLDSPNELKILAPSIVREIHYRLMNSRYGTKIRQLGVVGSRSQRIGKVVDHLQKDYAAPLKVSELARMANMSPSAFHLHFRQVTNMSPLQYQKQIRLQEARRMLSVEPIDAASVAFKVGYESASQFSREYRRIFGQPPMRDVERLRQSAGQGVVFEAE